MKYASVTQADIAAFEQMLDVGRVFSGAAVSEDYSHDEMTEYGCFMPEAVLEALSIEEISQVLAYCSAHHIAVTPRGAGTGLCGGCVAKYGGIVLSTHRMNRLIEIDRANRTATVQPGLLLMEFAKKLEGTGLFYPPDPGEKSATLGGNVMTNAGGMRAVRFGVTRDYVLGMKAVLASGEILTLGGKTVKTSSGYNLMQLLCGSEGTLAFLGEITVKLVAEPRINLSVLVPFDDLEKCIGAVPEVLRLGVEPTAVEFMEREVIEASEVYLGKQFPDKQADAYLLVRLDGASAEALQPPLDALTELLLNLGAKDVLLADTDERKSTIWDARGAFLEAINGSTPSMDECDVVVPCDQITAFIRAAGEISQEHKVRIRSFGHAGDGNLHLYVCKDAIPDDAWDGVRVRTMQALYDTARTLGGQISGEHGVGHAKVDFLTDSVGETQMQIMRGIKRAFDPNGILNPGKVVGFAE